jgi:brother of ihog
LPSIPIEGFFIYYRSATMAGDYTKATVMGENTRLFLITHLLPDTSYDIKIQAFNSAGTSGFSELGYYRTLCKFLNKIHLHHIIKLTLFLNFDY